MRTLSTKIQPQGANRGLSHLSLDGVHLAESTERIRALKQAASLAAAIPCCLDVAILEG